MLFSSCANKIKNDTVQKVTPTLVKPKPVVSTSVVPETLPSLPAVTTPIQTNEVATYSNTTGPYPDLKNADAPPTTEQLNQEIDPVLSAPANVITP